MNRTRGIPVALVAAVGAACGGSAGPSGATSTPGHPSDSGVAATDAIAQSDAAASVAEEGSAAAGDGAAESTVSDDGGADAVLEPPDDGPWPADHYPMPQMTQLGGAVLASPRVVTVSFAGNANRDSLRAFDDRLVEGSAWWNAVTAGYGVGVAQGGVYAELPDTVSTTVMSDAQLQGKIVQWIGAGSLPTPDENTLLLIYFPSSTTITLQGQTSCSGFGGYHTSTQVPLDGGLVETAYAVLPNCGSGMQGLTFTASHEIVEAVVDPHPQSRPAWYGYNDAWFGGTSSTGTGAEVADVCERFAPVADANNDALSRSWVNLAAAASHDPCQPTPAGEIFYAAAVPTQTIQINGIGVQYDSDGYVLMKAGDTQTLDVVIFSEAKLPNDVQLTVGRRSRGALTASIAAGITATVSPTSGHNGVHVALSLQVAASVTKGNYPFAVRAALNANDYHDWPVILKVQ